MITVFSHQTTYVYESIIICYINGCSRLKGLVVEDAWGKVCLVWTEEFRLTTELFWWQFDKPQAIVRVPIYADQLLKAFMDYVIMV